MKKLFSFFIAMLLMFSAFCGVSVSAASDDVGIYYDFDYVPQVVYTENTVSIPVLLTVEDGNASAVVTNLSFDENVFEFQGYNRATDSGEHNLELGVVEVTENDPGVVGASFVSSDGTSTTEFDDTLLCNLRFKVLEDAEPGEYEFTVVKSQVSGVLYNGEEFYSDAYDTWDLTVEVDTAYNFGVAQEINLYGEAYNFTEGEIGVLDVDGVWRYYELADEIVIDGYDYVLQDIDPDELQFSYREEEGYLRFPLNRFVGYKLDEYRDVIELVTEADDIYGCGTVYFKRFKTDEDGAYFGSYKVADDALVFNIGVQSAGKLTYSKKTMYTTDLSILKNNKDYYEVILAGYTDEGYSIVAGIFDFGMDFSQPLFTVVDIHENSILNGKKGTVFEGVENGVTRAYMYDEGYSCVYGVTVDGYELSVTDEEVQVQPGDVLTVYANDGIIIDAAKMFDVDDYATADSFTTPEKNFIGFVNEDWDEELISGYVAAVNGNRAFLSTDESLLGTDNVDDLYEVFLSDGDATYYDFTKETPVSAGSISDIKPGTMVLAKEVDSRITDAVVILNDSSYAYEPPAVKENNYNYAFVTKLSLEGTQGNYESAKIRLLLPSNEWKTVDIAEEITINGEAYNLCAMTVRTIGEALDIAVYGSDVEAYCNIIFNQMVCYDTNDNGEIDEIIFGIKNINEVETAKIYSGKYTDNRYLGFYNLTDSTKIYSYTSIPSNEAIDESNITVTDISVLNKDVEYKDIGIYAVTDENPTIGIMVGHFEDEVDFESPFFVVSKVLTETLTDMECLAILGLHNGEEVTYYYNPDSAAEIVSITEENGYAVPSDKAITPAHGDVLSVKVDSNGFILKAVKIWNVNDFADEDYFIMPEAINGYKVKGEDDSRFVTGFVCDRNSTRTSVGISLNPEHYQEGITDDRFYIRDANVTEYDFTVSKNNRICQSSVNAIEPGTMILARVDDSDAIQDVVVIYNEATDREENFVRELDKGDADGDGKLTVKDAVIVLRSVADTEALSAVYRAAADVDGDRTVTVMDATRILKYISRLINSL